MKNIVKKEEAVSKQFLGVDFVVLSIGKDTMVTKMLYKTTDNVPFHKHPNEQSGYAIPANVEHSIEIIKAGEVVDVFSPIRQDYL